MAEPSPEIIIDSLVAPPIQTNLYVIGCAETGRGAIVDGGNDAAGLIRIARNHELDIEMILQTHAHIDHVAGINDLVEEIDAPIYLHPADAELWQMAPQQGQMFGFDVEPLPDYDRELAEGDEIEIGELTADVLHLPGHSPGSVGFHFEEQSVIFSGDVLFAGSIGRVDLPGSDRDQMKESLQRMSELPEDTKVLNGHGPQTQVGREKKVNPFLRQDW